MKIKPMLGEFELAGIEYVESAERRALVEHRVPGLAGSYYQDMGSAPNAILIVGTQAGDDKRDSILTGIRGLFNKGEPTTFIADINTATDLTDVVIQDFQVAEVGGEPSSFRYQVTLRRYVEPPEPPATDSLDAGILDDALSVTDALDVLDTLGSIPSLGDPTPPLREALGGVQGATTDLPAVIEQVRGLAQALPTEALGTTDVLAPVTGDRDGTTGIAGALGLLETLGGPGLSEVLGADLDQSVSTKLAIDPSSMTGGSLAQLQRAVGAVPQDPSSLTQPLRSKLDSIRQLSGPDLSQQLLGGLAGFDQIGAVVPSDTSGLVDSLASRLSQVKGEMIRGQFGDVIRWSTSVAGLHAEVEPLLVGTGNLEERLTTYLRGKVDAIVALLLPGGDLAAALESQLAGAAPVALPMRVEALRADLIAHLAAARADFDAGNVTNTAHLAAAEAAFQELTELLAGATGKLTALLDEDLLDAGALGARVQSQLDGLDRIEIVDLGNIKDKFAAGLGKIAEIIGGIDLGAVTRAVEDVFSKVDAVIGKIDLRQLSSRIAELKQQIQSALEAMDGALLEAVAAIRDVLVRIQEAVRDVAENLGSYDTEGLFHYDVEQQIREFLAGIRSSLHDTVQPLVDRLKQSIAQTLGQVGEALESVRGQIEGVKNQLAGTLQGTHERLQSVDVKGTIASIRDGLDGMLSQLGSIDFDVVVNPVVAEIDEMRDALKKIDVSKLNDLTIGALKVSVELVIHLDFTAQITDALMGEIDKLLEYPKTALAEIEGRVEGAIREFGRLAPEALLQPLNHLFAPVTEHLNALKLETLLEPLDAWYARMKGQIDAISPAALLQPLIDLYLQLEHALDAISPAALIQPLQEAIDGIKADVRRIDVGSVAAQVTRAIENVRGMLAKLSPAGLLTPLVSAFDKILAALDQFDPAALLQPFADLFAAVADVLANLSADGVKAIASIFTALRDIVDAFDPRRIFTLVRDELAKATAVLRQLDLGGLLVSLRAPFDSMQASFTAHGSGAELTVKARVEGLNPLRSPALGAIVSDVQALLPRLTAFESAQPPAALVERYEKARALLDGLIPIWAREGISAASIQRAFEAANPLGLKAEIDALYDALKQKLRTFDPRLVQSRLEESYDRLVDALNLDPAPLLDAQELLNALADRLDAIDLRLITRELQALVGEVKTVIGGLDPRPIIANLQGIVDELKAVVEALRPSLLLAELQQPLDTAKAIVAAFDPAGFTEPLQAIFKDIQALLADIDVGEVLQPIATRLQELRDKLEEALSRTEDAFNGMLKAIPV